ncbi:hypothetical protein FBU30_010073 [Linnemannia zychae]|nr:hypothetical protein FBU30_010073 [Linnemannia zychae]
MAWIGRALGTSATRGTRRGDIQCQQWSIFLYTATTATSAKTSLISARPRMLTHSTFSHRHWIHSSAKTHKESVPTSAKNTKLEPLQPPLKTKALKRERDNIVWNPEIDAKILEMRLEGSTWEEIGMAVGIDRNACHRHYFKELDPSIHQRWTPEKIDRLNAMVAEGRSWRYIADKLLIIQASCREKWMSLNQDIVQKIKEAKRLERAQTIRPTHEYNASTVEIYRRYGLIGSMRYRWSPLMDAILLELRDYQKLNWRQIGSVLGMVPMSCYMRYIHRIKPQLASGWIPPKIDHTNVPYYLFSQRIRPFPAPSFLNATTTNATQHTNTDVEAPALPTTSVPMGLEKSNGFVPWIRWRGPLPKNNSVPPGLLALLGDDFSYDVREPEIWRSRVWTTEEDSAIITGRAQRNTFEAIGGRLKIDARLCQNRFYAVLDPNTRDKEWTPDLIAKLRFLVEQGMAWSLISDLIGFNYIICREKYREISRPFTNSAIGSSEDSQQRSDTSHGTSVLRSANATDIGVDITTDTETSSSNENQTKDEQDLKGHHGELEDEHKDSGDSYDGSYDDDIYDDDAYEDETEVDEDDNVIDSSDHNDDDSMMSMDGSEENENSIADYDSLALKKNPRYHTQVTTSTYSHTPAALSIWDQDLYMQERQKTWTTEEETALIRHVIRNGTRNWEEIAAALGSSGQNRSAEECRAYWKFLDMPVIRHNRQPPKWNAKNESLFWQLWLEKGADFEDIARTMTVNFSNEIVSTAAATTDAATVFEAKDCQQLFQARTRHLLKNNEDQEVKKKAVKEKELYKEYIKIARERIRPLDFNWNKEKSVNLQKIVRQRLRSRGMQVNWINWKWVARNIGGGATAQRCSTHWRALREIQTATDWTNEDILLLEKGLREIGTIFNGDNSENFEDISISSDDLAPDEPNSTGFRAIRRFYLPEHSIESIRRQYFLLSDKATNVTVEEYTTIMEAVDEYGVQQWDKVVKHLNTLSDSSSSSTSGWTKAPCRRVWEASYKSQLFYTDWSAAEDIDLRESVEHLGQDDWNTISRFFPGKSAWQCRLRWCQVTDPQFQSSSVDSLSSSSSSASASLLLSPSSLSSTTATTTTTAAAAATQSSTIS